MKTEGCAAEPWEGELAQQSLPHTAPVPEEGWS